MTQQVMIKTNYGEVVVSLYPTNTSDGASEFLRYVGADHWDPSFDKTIVVSNGTVTITTWDIALAKFTGQGTVDSNGQAVLDLIDADDSTAPAVIYSIEYIVPPEPAT